MVQDSEPAIHDIHEGPMAAIVAKEAFDFLFLMILTPIPS